MSDRADPNAADQAAMWNGAMGARWLEYHQRLHALLEPFGKASIEALGDIAGKPVVDLGCGTGETTATIAELVGTDGRAVGLDISEQLVAAAQAAQADSGAEYRVADVGAADLGGPYAAAHSRFGVMFFPEPVGAYANIRSHLEPGGRFAAAVWQPPSENEWVWRPMSIVGEHVELPEGPPPGGPGPFSMGDPDVARAVLDGAGFSHVELQDVRLQIGVGGDRVQMASFLLAMLPTGPVLDELGPERTAELAETVADGLPEENGVSTLEGAIWLVTASA